MANNILEFWRLGGDDPLEPVFSSAPIMLHSIDANGKLINVSSFEAEKLGYQPHEMIGRASIEFLTEESRAYAANVVLPEFFKTGQIQNIEYDFVRKNGDILPVLMSAVAQYDAQGAFVRSLAVLFDNSEAKRIEAALVRSQRMEAMGQMVGGVAHDFNNLLAVIQGSLDLLVGVTDEAEREELIQDAYEATRSGAHLTQQLLAFGSRSSLNADIVDINDVVSDVVAMLKRVLPATVELKTSLGADLPPASLDRRMLENALLNVVNNARDSLDNDRGVVVIETRTVDVRDGQDFTFHDTIIPGSHAILSIIDDGCGMTPETTAKMFEPFFTTKPPDQGTGLGLAMVFGFMKQSKGLMRVESAPDLGSSVHLYFPEANTPPAQKATRLGQATNKVRPDSGAIRVFIVEDDAKVRKVLVKQLKSLGVEVTASASGDNAYRRLEDGYRPDILITDVVMPGALQGPALAAEARRLAGDLHVILLTGYPSEFYNLSDDAARNDLLFTKPVEKEILLKAVANIIEEIMHERTRRRVSATPASDGAKRPHI